MKKFIILIITYVILTTITIFLPVDEHYNTTLWRVIFSQAYSIPLTILVAYITHNLLPKKKDL